MALQAVLVNHLEFVVINNAVEKIKVEILKVQVFNPNQYLGRHAPTRIPEAFLVQFPNQWLHQD